MHNEAGPLKRLNVQNGRYLAFGILNPWSNNWKQIEVDSFEWCRKVKKPAAMTWRDGAYNYIRPSMLTSEH